MKIKTLDLMMAAARLPIHNYLEEVGKQKNAKVDNLSTKINIFRDAFKDKNIFEVIPKENTGLIDAINEFIATVSPSYFHLLMNYSSATEIAKPLIEKYHLPELSDIRGKYSLAFAIVLITEIKDFPGYDYQVVVETYRQSNPGLPEGMMATVFCRNLPENIYQLAFEFRDWWKNQEKPTDILSHFNVVQSVSSQLKLLQEKYQIDDFFEC